MGLLRCFEVGVQGDAHDVRGVVELHTFAGALSSGRLPVRFRSPESSSLHCAKRKEDESELAKRRHKSTHSFVSQGLLSGVTPDMQLAMRKDFLEGRLKPTDVRVRSLRRCGVYHARARESPHGLRTRLRTQSLMRRAWSCVRAVSVGELWRRTQATCKLPLCTREHGTVACVHAWDHRVGAHAYDHRIARRRARAVLHTGPRVIHA
jgi:hypothetical protein